jgi:hypothetical protein
VLQGDIFSPAAFIFALALIMVRYATRKQIAGTDTEDLEWHEGSLFEMIQSLEYADDAALVDRDPEQATRRLTAIAEGARRDADMEISVPKTECMHCKIQDAVSPVCAADYERLSSGKNPALSFKCAHCGRCFDRHQGRALHITRFCTEAKAVAWTEVYEVEQVLDVRGAPEFRYYLVRWEGYAPKDDSWVQWRRMLGAGQAVDTFWAGSALNKEAAIEVAGEHRCRWCNKQYTGAYAARSIKSHYTRGCDCAPRTRVGSRAEKVVIQDKIKRAQVDAGDVFVEGQPLKNVAQFKYLGNRFKVDGNRRFAAEVRMGEAKSRFGKLRHIWDSGVFPVSAKLRLFEAAVVSVLVYGCEAWTLDEAMMSSLRGWCAKCVTRFTGKSIREENRHPTYPLVQKVQQRRLKWVGHILRLEESSLIQQVVLELVKEGVCGSVLPAGSLLMDVPKFSSVWELMEMAGDRQYWNELSNALCPKLPSHEKKKK